MKSVEERAERFIVEAGMVQIIDSRTEDELIEATIRLLKEQDKITRHACSEAINNCGECETNDDNAIYREDSSITDSVIDKDEAYAACMNAKAL